eukprot:TRINITY_DN5867_c0_g1_i1.p1 TRINITY_DN5867_c0_g1~~TRINITY_DN5867_c0_g1_i1.p1  ORF type:complete len:1757 (+),score=367.23 TRINITY_DN5867_c0_g1_i1:16-5286(+)
MEDIFHQKSFSLVSSSLPRDLHRVIKDYGGKIDYLITKKTDFVVSTLEEVQKGSSKIRSAEKHSVLIVNADFVYDSIDNSVLLDPQDYLLQKQKADTEVKFSYESDFVTEMELQRIENERIQLIKEQEKRQEAIQGNATGKVTKEPREYPLGPVIKTAVVKYKSDDTHPVYFPSNYELVYYKTLQWTDLNANHNKYYGIEYHKAIEGTKEYFRIFTHYGRTDDLASNPNSGIKQCRYYDTEEQAEDAFASIVLEKTEKKGYKPVILLFSNIGSDRLRALMDNQDEKESSNNVESALDKDVAELIEYLFQEATTALINTMGPIRITQKGIETPIGVVTLSQITAAEQILTDISLTSDTNLVQALSNQFYTTIPHNFGGRSRSLVQNASISDESDIEQKRELLQLMKDMLNVTAATAGMKLAEVDMKYHAIKNQIQKLNEESQEFGEVNDYILSHYTTSETALVVNIFKLKRSSEEIQFRRDLHNQRMLYHGSRPANFVGLLSRGILMPRTVLSKGGKRRDAGFLGNGIYFGDSITTSAKYSSPGSRNTRFMLVCTVALGETKDYENITYGLDEAPLGYQSTHGVMTSEFNPTDFNDDEFVIYNTEQQKQEYLVEFVVSSDPAFPLYKGKKKTIPKIVKKLPQGESIRNSSSYGSSKLRNSVNKFRSSTKSYEQDSWRTEFLSNSLSDSTLTLESTSLKITSMLDTSTSISLDESNDTALDLKTSISSLELPKEKEEKEDTSFYSLLDSFSFNIRLGRENTMIKNSEDKYRELFAKHTDNYKLEDPYLHLIDIFKKREDFQFAPYTNEDKEIPLLLTKFMEHEPGKPSILSKEEYFDNFSKLTGGVLEGLDFSNLLVAGGAVLGCSIVGKREFDSSDIDIFLYDLQPEQANEKLREIYDLVCSNVGEAKLDIIRTEHAVTILGTYPIPHIQIILRLYKSPAEILMGFDIDACCIGYDGNKVWALPRAKRAITKRYNLVDMSRRSLTYESRLYKYAKRGFSVAVPGLHRHLINPDLFEKSPKDVNGLGKLLIFEYALTNRSQGRFGTWTVKSHRLKKYEKNSFSEDQINEYEQIDSLKTSDCDYSSLFIPWGPQWPRSVIAKEVKYRENRSFFSEQNKHISYFGIENIISGIPSHGNEIKPLEWLTQNPGTQLLTGSFHPVSDDKWFDDAYYKKCTSNEYAQWMNSLCFSGDKTSLYSLLLKNKSADTDLTQIYTDFTPLMTSISLGNNECAKLLIEKNANVNYLMPNLFTPLHVAAFYGDVDIFRRLLRGGASPDTPAAVQPLHIASFYGSYDIVNTLLLEDNINLEYRDSKGNLALYYAAEGGFSDIVSRLLESNMFMKNGDDETLTNTADIAEAFEIARQRGNTKCAVLLGRALGYRADSVYSSSTKKSVQRFKTNLNDPNYPLLCAVSTGSLDDVINCEGDLNECDSCGVSALHITAQRNYADIANYLIVAGANISSRDVYGNTPLHYAVLNCSLEMVDILCKSPESNDLVNQFGHSAYYYCLYQIVKLAHDDCITVEQLDKRTKLFLIREILKKKSVASPVLNHYEPTDLPNSPFLDTWKEDVTIFHDNREEVEEFYNLLDQKAAKDLKRNLIIQKATNRRSIIKGEEEKSEKVVREYPVKTTIQNIANTILARKTEKIIVDPPVIPAESKYSLSPVQITRAENPEIVNALDTALRDMVKEEEKKPSDFLSKILLKIASLYKQQKITPYERGVLKTLSLQQHFSIKGALMAYEVDKDENDFVDTLKKICVSIHV